jgi:hypothetical protein
MHYLLRIFQNRDLTIRSLSIAMLLFNLNVFAGESTAREDPDVVLQHIRAKMMEHFSQLRNYTCHVTVDRLIKRVGYNTMERQDRVSLEAAFVGDRELFSRDGETRFEERSVSSMVAGGMISNNALGFHEDAVLSGDGAEFKYRGPCKKDGHKTYRYDFHIGEEKSHFLVRHNAAEAIVGYKGTIWVDADTLDIVRVDWKSDRIPSSVGISSIEKTMHYKILRIGHTDFLLPAASELAANDERGNFSLNMITLEACREFTGESQVTYDTPAGSPSTRSGVPEP